jgi:hypothetical protein
MPLKHDEAALHALTMARIETGELPGEAAKATWAGNGGGDPCALCRRRIGKSEVEYEIQDIADRVFLFHLQCHAIWQFALASYNSELESRQLDSRKPRPRTRLGS